VEFDVEVVALSGDAGAYSPKDLPEVAFSECTGGEVPDLMTTDE
jgi:hypothetical protein